ncbi:MAG: STAS domain-containing protein [Phycisphaerae bacterium]
MGQGSDTVVKAVRHVGPSVVVELAGEVDMYRTPQLLTTLSSITESQPPRVVVDLSEVQYMDSSGVGTLVHLFRQVKSYQGQLILVGPRPRVRSIFEITRLDRFFTICQTQSEALAR